MLISVKLQLICLFTMAGKEPLFCKNTDLCLDNETISSLEMCDAMADVVSGRLVKGAQLINGIWRLYLHSLEAKIELVTKGFSVRGKRVQIFEQNPRHINTDDPDAKVEKITLKDIPLSIDNKAVEDFFSGYSQVKLTSEVMHSKERRPDTGRLTNYLNGDRYVFAIYPVLPILPHKAKVAGHYSRIFHATQREICRICGEHGHTASDGKCPGYVEHQNVVAFSGHENPLSNFYPCEPSLRVFGREHKSAEEAFQAQKAYDIGRDDIAENILNSKHAGAAKAIARDEIPKLHSEKWNQEKADDVMKEILDAKFDQVADFREALLGTGDAILAEATSDIYWACGLTRNQACHTKPSFWKGNNVLGAMLIEIREAEKRKMERNLLDGDMWSEDDKDTELDDFDTNLETDNDFPPCGQTNNSQNMEESKEADTFNDLLNNTILEVTDPANQSTPTHTNQDERQTTTDKLEDTAKSGEMPSTDPPALWDQSQRSPRPKTRQTRKSVHSRSSSCSSVGSTSSSRSRSRKESPKQRTLDTFMNYVPIPSFLSGNQKRKNSQSPLNEKQKLHKSSKDGSAEDKKPP